MTQKYTEVARVQFFYASSHTQYIICMIITIIFLPRELGKVNLLKHSLDHNDKYFM